MLYLTPFRIISINKPVKYIIAQHKHMIKCINYSLGSDHDGSPGSKSCDDKKKEQGYIMAPVANAASPNTYLFSSCSIQSISNLIQGVPNL